MIIILFCFIYIRYQVLERDYKTAQQENNRYQEQFRESQTALSLLREKFIELQSKCEHLESEKQSIKTEFEKFFFLILI